MGPKRIAGTKRPASTAENDVEDSLNIKITLEVRKNDESDHVSDIYAVAELADSGAPRREVVKRHVTRKLCDSSVAELKGTLVKRGVLGTDFHRMCDDVSDELRDAGDSMFDDEGRLIGPITEIVTDESCNHGGFLYITSVEVKEKHRGNDIGINLCHAVMQELRKKWTLAMMFPAPLRHNSEETGVPFQLVVEKISRYFARIGFRQVCGGRSHPLNKYWVVEASTFPDRIRSKEECREIQVSAMPASHKPQRVDQDLMDVLKDFQDPQNGSMFFCGSHYLSESTEKVLRQRLQEVIDRGGDVNRSHCLHCAAANGLVRAVTILINDFGARVNEQDERGSTPLHVAAARQQDRVISRLLIHGADKTIRNIQGETPLQTLQEAHRSQGNFLRVMGLQGERNPREAQIVQKCTTLLSV